MLYTLNIYSFFSQLHILNENNLFKNIKYKYLILSFCL